MQLKHVHLQYDRLERHYNAALANKDEISFLDLAHALRIWVDMKSEITQMSKDHQVALTLDHYTSPKFIKQSLKGAKHTFIPIASGVESPDIQVKGVIITNRALTPEEIKKRASMGPPVAQRSKMSFLEWMATGVIEVPSGDPEHPHLKLSREIIIKRVANALGASHPVGMEDGDSKENGFDKYILELHQLIIADGYPATYYQLLEIAGEILQRTKGLREIS